MLCPVEASKPNSALQRDTNNPKTWIKLQVFARPRHSNAAFRPNTIATNRDAIPEAVKFHSVLETLAAALSYYRRQPPKPADQLPNYLLRFMKK